LGHPGTLDMSAAELARKLRVPANRITAILNGQRSVTGDTALRFGHFFHTSPEFWLNLQAIYDLRIAQQKFGDAIRSLPTLPRGGKRPRGRSSAAGLSQGTVGRVCPSRTAAHIEACGFVVQRRATKSTGA